MNQLKKNTLPGKTNFLIVLIYFIFINVLFFENKVFSGDNLEGKFIEIKILDKVSSKNSLLKLKIGVEKRFKNLLIKTPCKNVLPCLVY